jgi:hypothetical protein
MVHWDYLLSKRREWEREDLLDVIYWLRVILAAVSGLASGLLGLVGIFGFSLSVAKPLPKPRPNVCIAPVVLFPVSHHAFNFLLPMYPTDSLSWASLGRSF